jgi:hypothetical protein
MAGCAYGMYLPTGTGNMELCAQSPPPVPHPGRRLSLGEAGEDRMSTPGLASHA